MYYRLLVIWKFFSSSISILANNTSKLNPYFKYNPNNVQKQKTKSRCNVTLRIKSYQWNALFDRDKYSFFLFLSSFPAMSDKTSNFFWNILMMYLMVPLFSYLKLQSNYSEISQNLGMETTKCIVRKVLKVSFKHHQKK